LQSLSISMQYIVSSDVVIFTSNNQILPNFFLKILDMYVCNLYNYVFIKYFHRSSIFTLWLHKFTEIAKHAKRSSRFNGGFSARRFNFRSLSLTSRMTWMRSCFQILAKILSAISTVAVNLCVLRRIFKQLLRYQLKD